MREKEYKLNRDENIQHPQQIGQSVKRTLALIMVRRLKNVYIKDVYFVDLIQSSYSYEIMSNCHGDLQSKI